MLFCKWGHQPATLWCLELCPMARSQTTSNKKKKLFLTQNNFAIFESLPFLLEKGRNFFRKKIEIKILDTASFFSIWTNHFLSSWWHMYWFKTVLMYIGSDTHTPSSYTHTSDTHTPSSDTDTPSSDTQTPSCWQFIHPKSKLK
jgi:hypothetical protein